MGILTGKGINAQRRLYGDRSSVDDELTDIVTTSAPPMWLRAVVVDVIFDPNLIPAKIKDELFDTLTNPQLLTRIPRNSIIARVITNASARRGSTPAIFYPMIPHISVPIKPGEHAWVMFEDPNGARVQGFWLSRISEPDDVDDINFTHGDRKFDDRSELTAIEKMLQKQGLNVTADVPGFPNGGNTHESLTLDAPDGYEKINKAAHANGIITKEAVPRYTKRPADLALMGSNNTLIVMGEDRIGAAAEFTGEAVKKIDSDVTGPSAGSIDIVVGRGQQQSTAPNTIQNTRQETEVDKIKENLDEGNPDFENDMSRFYLAMNTRGDSNFSITGNDLPKIVGGADPTTFDEGAFSVIKSEHIRIIARQNDTVNGSIRIIKEGEPDDEGGRGRAAILIEPDGSVIIDGPHIVLGSDALEKANGAGQHIFLGRDATEPVVLGNELKQLLKTYTEDIKVAIDAWTQGFNVLLSQIASAAPPSFGNFAIPIPGLVALAALWQVQNATLKQQVDAADAKLDANVDKILSKVGKTR